MSKTDSAPPNPAEHRVDEIHPPAGEREYAEDGTDLTLIRWMLSLTPDQRLQVLQSQIDFIARVRRQNGIG